MSLLYFKVYAFSTKSPQNNLNIKSNILQVTNKQLAPLIDENVIFFRWYHILIIQNNHIRNSADWNKVINESKVPIVLDCYATWCEPCKKLTPILEEKAKNAKGAWKLIKLDIDEVPELATALKVNNKIGFNQE